MDVLGCIADDFTGATDVGAALVHSGYRTKVIIDSSVPFAADDVDAYVIALKSRTTPVEDAVRVSLDAVDSLLAAGAERFYFKYCSTFDSTPSGNIGPVTDAMLSRLGLNTALMVPSFPANGRTVYQGHLFVHDQLLSESPMRTHPLTPMTDSNLETILAPQTDNAIRRVGLHTVRSAEAELRAALEAPEQDSTSLVIVDAIDEDDLARISAAAPYRALLTGGAGLAGNLSSESRSTRAGAITTTEGYRLVVSGSASQMTRAQTAAARVHMPSLKLDVAALMHNSQAEIGRAVDWAIDAWATGANTPVLVFATETEDDLGATADNRAEAAAAFEHALAEITAESVAAGVRQVIVAGGETSGAVVSRLGISELRIGPAIAPGVVWAEARDANGTMLNLALKSGNFGDINLFSTAWEQLE
ncbi:3-oxo-tetronate kinase [Mycetocola sp. 2940]|uniref:3-oxo-tetronate kinase n=1 Tax=Mycetocola sp. 2940 TaxID=3156452 RepID=UPI0033962EF8